MSTFVLLYKKIRRVATDIFNLNAIFFLSQDTNNAKTQPNYGISCYPFGIYQEQLKVIFYVEEGAWYSLNRKNRVLRDNIDSLRSVIVLFN